MFDRLFRWCLKLAVPAGARDDLLGMLAPGGTGVEIGVWRGEFSQRILELAKPQELHLVDPWIFAPQFPRRMYGGKKAKSQADMDCIAQLVRHRFDGDSRVQIHRCTSREFFRSQSDRQFDWVYLDGDHSEDTVYQDLKDAWTQVKPGGVICGDDYLWLDEHRCLSVRRAVNRFIREVGVPLERIGTQYALRKPTA